jgi:ABC-2 type transport system ATP-binding protein
MDAGENNCSQDGVLLSASGLSHSYGAFQALTDIDLSIRSGELVVLQGPNGAGKSTLLQCLGGLLQPSTGQVLVGGHDLYQDEVPAKRCLAFVPDVPLFYQELTVWEHLEFIARAHGVTRLLFPQLADQVLHDFGLWEARYLYPHALSRGMRLKLGLCLAFVRPFRILLLDEPTSALDASSAALLRQRLLNLQAEGAAVLLATHEPGLAVDLGGNTWGIQHGRLEPR